MGVGEVLKLGSMDVDDQKFTFRNPKGGSSGYLPLVALAVFSSEQLNIQNYGFVAV
jgi:hypothetical protein